MRQADAGALRPLRQVPRLLRLSRVQERAAARASRCRPASSAPTAARARSCEQRSRRGKIFYSCNRYPGLHVRRAGTSPIPSRARSATRRSSSRRRPSAPARCGAARRKAAAGRCARRGRRAGRDGVPRAPRRPRASRRRGPYGGARRGAGGREAGREGRGKARTTRRPRRQGRDDRARRRRARCGGGRRHERRERASDHHRRRARRLRGGLAARARAASAVDLYEMRPVRGTEAHTDRSARRAGVLELLPQRHARDRRRAAEGGDAAARLARHARSPTRTACPPARALAVDRERLRRRADARGRGASRASGSCARR